MLRFWRSRHDAVGQHFNREEHPGVCRGALALRDLVAARARIIPGVLTVVCYSWMLLLIDERFYKLLHLDIAPFEYTGAALGLLPLQAICETILNNGKAMTEQDHREIL